jgi:hypothetical protein
VAAKSDVLLFPFAIAIEVFNLTVEYMPAARNIAIFHHNIECGGVGWPDRKVTTSQQAKKGSVKPLPPLKAMLAKQRNHTVFQQTLSLCRQDGRY